VTKTPIEIKRNSGGLVHIGTPEDGVVETMVEIDGSLFFIKEKGIYAVQMADQIDPDRTNISLPNAIPRTVLPEGSDCELVGKTLLTAVSLFDKGKLLPNGFDHGKALSLSLDVLTTLLAMHTGATEFEAAQQKACAKASSAFSGGSPHIPSMGDVTNPCRAFVQQAFHAQGSLLAIVQLFYRDIKKRPWDTLYHRVKASYGADDTFIQFLSMAVPFLKGVMNIRDCLDHRNVKGVKLKDFALQPDGQPTVPTIEVNFRGTRQTPISLAKFMTDVQEYFATVFEMMIAHLCSTHVKLSAPTFPVYIDMPAGNRRRWKHVRFYYGLRQNGEFTPVG